MLGCKASDVVLAYLLNSATAALCSAAAEDMIPEMAAEGVKNLVVVPISFVSEHIETLEEIDIEYRELAESCGIT